MKTRPRIQEEGTLGLAAWTGQSHGMASAHRHLDLEINFVLSGTMRYLVGGRLVDRPPHRLCLLWGGVPHQMIRSRQTPEVIWVTVPLAGILRWGLPDHLIRPLLAAGFLADPAPRSGDLDLLNQWLSDLPGRGERQASGSEADPAGGIVLLEIEARLRRFAQSLSHPLAAPLGTDLGAAETGRTPEGSGGSATAHHDRGLAAVEAMAQYLSRHFRDDIGVADIARSAHLHPNYAMTLFRRHTGMTLTRYLTLQRVAHAQRLLATTDDPIQEIAFGSGFQSISRFYEAFRQQTGNSPYRFRLHLQPDSR
ncbi:MAG: helix-turn-helix domain-containing protein [Cytophagales bacterium]|nr:helix-turn-helix domain-containing protein [Armatimonadota bacterium]